MRSLLKNRLFILILVAILVLSGFTCLALVSRNRSGPVANVVNAMVLPLQKGVSATGELLGRVVSGFSENKALENENTALREKVAALEAEIRELNRYAEENEAMRQLLGITSSDISLTLSMGSIVSRSGLSWARTLTADLGSADGIAVYDAVITAEGLVGYVSSVSLTSCQITTVIDSSMSCSAILSDSRHTGVAEGSFRLMEQGRLALNLLPAGADISVGDTAETSGLGGIFPKGLVIGRVESSHIADDGLSKTAVIAPSVDISSLTTVFIITDFETVSK